MKNYKNVSEQISIANGIIRQRLKEIYAEAIYTGQQPLENADNNIFLVDRVMPITRMTEVLIADIALLLNPKYYKEEYKVLYTQSKLIETSLEGKISEEEKRLNIAGHGKSDLLKAGLFCLLWLFSAVFLYWGEAKFLTDSLQVIAANRADAKTYAMGICTAIIIISHGIPVLINNYILSKRWQRRVARALLLLFVVGIFYGLGYWRNQYLNEMGKTAPPPWQFTIFNFGIFAAFYTVAELLLIPHAPELWLACKKYWIRFRKEWFITKLAKVKIFAVTKLDLLAKKKLDTDSIRHVIQKGYNHNVEAYKTAFLKRHGFLPPGDIPPLDFSPFDDGGDV